MGKYNLLQLGYIGSALLLAWSVVDQFTPAPASFGLTFTQAFLWAAALWLLSLMGEGAAFAVAKLQSARPHSQNKREKKNKTSSSRKSEKAKQAVPPASPKRAETPLQDPVQGFLSEILAEEAREKRDLAREEKRWPVRKKGDATAALDGSSKKINFEDLADLPPLLGEFVERNMGKVSPPHDSEVKNHGRRDEYHLKTNGPRFDARIADK